MDYHDTITVEPDKHGGRPCIRGLRITVFDVLSSLASGMTEEEILSDFPDLAHEDIIASLIGRRRRRPMRVAGGERASAATGFSTNAKIPPRQGRHKNGSDRDAIDSHESSLSPDLQH